jgi:glycerophosphoryl diester phosphodiesterase
MKSPTKYLILLLLFTVGLCSSIEPLYTPTALPTPAPLFHFPQYIAHKSIVSSEAIGNTWNDIEEALASYVDGIEVDVRCSKDNILFLYHAETLEESTNGYGKPEEHTWAQLSKISYNDSTQSSIVKLEDFLKVVGAQKFIFLDIKSDKIFNGELAQNLASLIARHHLQETIFVESFNPLFLVSMRLTTRDILLMYDFAIDTHAGEGEIQSQFDKIPWLLKRVWVQKQIRRVVRPDVLGPRYNTDKSVLQSLINSGYPIITWTVNDIKIAQEMFSIGVRGLQTNKPWILLNTLSTNTKKVVRDAGGTTTRPYKIIHVKAVEDIVQAIAQAKRKKKQITIAGRRHSMGGQALLDDSIQLNMLGFDKVNYDPKTQTIKANAGATWKKVQKVLDQHNRSVMVMQSDNIFTVGGSISVNVHGWQVGHHLSPRMWYQ